MDENVDLAAVVENLQADNEKLREAIAKIKLNPPKWWQEFSIRDITDLMQDNYFWIGVVAGAIGAIIYGVAPMFWNWRKDK